jgi:hypothetical protein
MSTSDLQEQIAGLIEVGYARFEELLENGQKQVFVVSDKVNCDITATNEVTVYTASSKWLLMGFLAHYKVNYSFVIDFPLGAQLEIKVEFFPEYKKDGLDRFKTILQEISGLYNDKDILVPILERLLRGVELLLELLVKPFQYLHQTEEKDKGPRRETLALIASVRAACQAFDIATFCSTPTTIPVTLKTDDQGFRSDVDRVTIDPDGNIVHHP